MFSLPHHFQVAQAPEMSVFRSSSDQLMNAKDTSMKKKNMSCGWSSQHVLVSLLLVCLINLSKIPQGVAVIAPEEEDILKILQESFNLPGWVGDPCQPGAVDWIICYDPPRGLNSVEKIYLNGLNLRGGIPAAMLNLRNVSVIDFSGNNLTGPIPDLSNMTSLTKVNFDINSLSGSFPNMSGLHDITEIILKKNNISGTIPASLFQHRSLKTLKMSGNVFLSGHLPKMDQLTNLTNLELESCALNGTIPASIGSATKLTVLYLGSNQLSGPLPDLSALTDLQWFDAGNNTLTGPLPPFESAGQLYKVQLHSNDMNGTIPRGIFQQDNLQYFRVDHNPSLSGQLPAQGSRLTQLIDFYVSDCNLTGPVPDYVQKWAQVNVMELQNNHFTSFPSNLSGCESLHVIKLSNNSISGRLPELPYGKAQDNDQKPLQYILMDNNNFSGEIPASWTHLKFAVGINIAYNNLSGVIPRGFGNLTSLQWLNMSRNAFSGPLPEEFRNLQVLEVLDLSNNQFNGTIPEVLLELPLLKKLFLQNNSFTGIPEAFLKTTKAWNFTYDKGDPNLKVIKRPKSRNVVEIVAGVLGALLAVLILSLLTYICSGKRKVRRQLKEFRADLPETVQYFSLREINAITENFKREIGKGGFGSVYYGKLPDNTEVAVKVRSDDSSQGVNEFKNEIKLLSRLHHRNLVPLIGYCIESKNQILVYVYMPKGTLEDHLYHKGSDEQPLSWKARLDILSNAAKGLEYLHKDCNPPVIHRDVKTSNILLTEKLEAKFGDLGISKQIAEAQAEFPNFNQTGVSTAIKGTIGYLDPEYFSRGKLTTKSDVFSFGVVLLETITGQKPQVRNFPSGMSMMESVAAADLKDEIDTVVDPALGNRYNREGMRKVVKMALSCMAPAGEKRPEMRDILRVLMDAYVIELGETLDEKPQKAVNPHVQWDDGSSNRPTTTTGSTSAFSNVSFSEDVTKPLAR
ncbi:hypothetical protein R1flu_010004 [Riccia fluitans]|uniref:Protein kinase domain-containing protein n=1 Tax=Riccia fluitans TaxID=41844 RepID=A0ABD1Z3R8_9MARC